MVRARQPGGPAPWLQPLQVPGLVQRGFLGASSEWSWQSNSPSHSHCLLLRQRPLAQRNSWGPQVGYSAGGWQAQMVRPTSPSQLGVTGALWRLGCAEPWHGCPNLPVACLGTGLHDRGQGGGKHVVLELSKTALCQGGAGGYSSPAPNPSHSLFWSPLTLLSC